MDGNIKMVCSRLGKKKERGKKNQIDIFIKTVESLRIHVGIFQTPRILSRASLPMLKECACFT